MDKNNDDWDPELKIWKNNKAKSNNESLPKPLWIFGYGSLCFKANFPFVKKMDCMVKDWTRRF